MRAIKQYCSQQSWTYFRSYWFNCTTFHSFAVPLQVTESVASDEMLGWGLGVYNTLNRKCVSEKTVHGGSTTFTIFQLLLEQCTVRPPIDNILFLHRFLSCDSSDCCIGLQIKSANLCFTEVEGVSLQQARIAVNPLHGHLRRREDATRLKPLSAAEGVDEQ